MDSLIFDKLLVIEEDKIEEDFFCNICNNIMFKNYQCTNGHIYCVSCTEAIKSKNTGCPECRIDLGSISVNRYLERQINKLKIFCPNKFYNTKDYIADEEFGCRFECSIDELETHIKNCEFSFIKCPINEECELVRKNLLDEHIKECDSKRIECELCKASILRVNLKKHYQTDCLQYTVTCRCGSKVKREFLPIHYANECANEMVDCIYGKLNGGCKGKVQRSEMDKHLLSSAHHQTIVNSFVSLREELELEKKKLNLCHTKFQGQWKIENWNNKFCVQPKGYVLRLNFSIGNRPLCLQLYPNGQTNDNKNSSLYLYNYYDLPISCNFTFEVVAGKDGIKKETVNSYILTKNGKGWEDFISAAKKESFGHTLIINFKVKITSLVHQYFNK
ncbi:hypothetical protein DICPUDRAFT_79968 [Dictyostelium purpureum]|uniref:RING-type domain-containing protein n=1 Tax=Dictyostelium purpureum TaxID=5786 RepID=F0ZP59_DICPU|nr:uncharacterized protein DICPUDRAFT_79968 [Dictyostelium purpureum]EGC34276.1 hypothetical protein DICPUDRAFT_79968 [Dictyostelium purpureum]|eukprot:XP_003289205.1 hypothetical protein DICPUDRAFT_79968 [Dictyostelium purpureum]